MEDLYVIVGLGNPGSKYEVTRHNVGFNTVDYLAAKWDMKLSKVKFKSVYGEGTVEGKRVLLVKPQTYMNLSGESVREIMDWYKLPPQRLILIYDDIDLEVGKVRLRPKGSAGTHNGMRSILYQIKTDAFPRVRIGIGKPPEGWALADYVLSRFSAEERKLVDEGIVKASETVKIIINSGIEAAMNQYNNK